MLTLNQIELCEQDGLSAARTLIARIEQHMRSDIYGTDEKRQAAALCVLGTFCDVFAGALDDVTCEGTREPASLARLLDHIVARHRHIAAALRERIEQGASHE